jgi:hypothetical protein
LIFLLKNLAKSVYSDLIIANKLEVSMARIVAPAGPAALLLCLSLACACQAGVITDNFNDNVWNAALWTTFSSGGSLVAAETGQRLQVTLTGDNALGGVRLRGLAYGDFEVQVNYSLLTNIDQFDHDGTPSGVGLLGAGGGGYAIRAVIDTGTPGPGIVGAYLGGELDQEDPWGWALTSDTSGRLRFTRTGNVFAAYYWASGAWAPLGSTTTTLTGPADLSLAVLTDGGNSVSVTFDEFYLQSDGFAAVPEPGSFGLAGVAIGLLCALTRRRASAMRRCGALLRRE